MLYKSKWRSKWKIRFSSFAPRNHCLIQLYVLFFFSPATHNPELCLPACHTPPIRATKETPSWSPEQDFIPFRKDSPEIPRGFSLPLCNLLSSNTPMKTVRLPCSLAPFLEDAVVKLAAPFTYTLYEFMPAYIKKLFWYKYLQCHYRLLAIKIRHNNNINHFEWSWVWVDWPVKYIFKEYFKNGTISNKTWSSNI